MAALLSRCAAVISGGLKRFVHAPWSGVPSVMLAAIRSAALIGIDAYEVIVEVDAAQGLPQWTIVGLAASAVKESRERVGAALVNSGFAVPPRRITVNLAPADIRKEGTAFDLPIAIGILVATGQLDAAAAETRCSWASWVWTAHSA